MTLTVQDLKKRMRNSTSAFELIQAMVNGPEPARRPSLDEVMEKCNLLNSREVHFKSIYIKFSPLILRVIIEEMASEGKVEGGILVDPIKSVDSHETHEAHENVSDTIFEKEHQDMANEIDKSVLNVSEKLSEESLQVLAFLRFTLIELITNSYM